MVDMFKLASVWGAAIGVRSWGDAAAMVAAVYTLAMLIDLLYRKIYKASCRHKAAQFRIGVLKGRRETDYGKIDHPRKNADGRHDA